MNAPTGPIGAGPIGAGPSPRPVDGFVFDLDGTVYLGNAALPGAVEAIATLRERGKRVLFVSNKPLEPREAYAAKLTRLGIPTPPDDVITSGYVLGHHIAHTEPHLRLYVIGEEALRRGTARPRPYRAARVRRPGPPRGH